MPKVYIIAGPPGVGKSTSGGSTIPAGINILDPDQIANRYKIQGFVCAFNCQSGGRLQPGAQYNIP